MLRDEAAKNECCLFGAQDGTSEGEGEDEWKVKQQRSVTEKKSRWLVNQVTAWGTGCSSDPKTASG